RRSPPPPLFPYTTLFRSITSGDVLLLGAPVDHMHATIAKLQEAGVDCIVQPEGLRVVGPTDLRPIDLCTRPYPGFPTDMQAQMRSEEHTSELQSRENLVC